MWAPGVFNTHCMISHDPVHSLQCTPMGSCQATPEGTLSIQERPVGTLYSVLYKEYILTPLESRILTNSSNPSFEKTEIKALLILL